jgi:hypothetical protein
MIIHRHVYVSFDSHNNIKVVIMRANPNILGVSVENKYDIVSHSSMERLELLLNKKQGYVSLHNARLFWDIVKIY